MRLIPFSSLVFILNTYQPWTFRIKYEFKLSGSIVLWLGKGKLLSLKYEVYKLNAENSSQTQLIAITTNLNQNNIYSII